MYSLLLACLCDLNGVPQDFSFFYVWSSAHMARHTHMLMIVYTLNKSVILRWACAAVSHSSDVEPLITTRWVSEPLLSGASSPAKHLLGGEETGSLVGQKKQEKSRCLFLWKNKKKMQPLISLSQIFSLRSVEKVELK